MALIVHFSLGFFLSFIGSTLPGMLNMTAVQISLERGFQAGRQYAIGAATAFFLHASIASVFASYLAAHPSVFTMLRQFAVFVFVALALAFLWQALQPKEIRASRKRGAPYTIGLFLSCLNVLIIPYFFGVTSYLGGLGYVQLSGLNTGAFVLGTMIGAFVLFYAYARFAERIVGRAQFITRNLHYFLAGLFTLLAIIQIIQLTTN